MVRKNKRGGLEIEQIIYVGVSLIMLVLMIILISTFLGDDYDARVTECNFFMENVDGKPKYFGDTLDILTLSFKSTIGGLCPSKDVTLEEEKLSDSAKLIKSCYNIIGDGEDFFGANVDDKSVCVHCGFIKVEDNINDFNKKLPKVLENEKYISLFDETDELVNTNKLFLSNKVLPNSVSDGDYLRVLAYAYKPSYNSEKTTFYEGITNVFSTSVSKYFGTYISSTGNFLLSDSLVGGFSGVVVEPFDGYEQFSTSREVKFTTGSSSLGCDVVIIPYENFDLYNVLNFFD
jgi:hypothetical protein